MRSRMPSNRIRSHIKGQLSLVWLFALLWNAMTWFFIIKAGDEMLRIIDEDPVFYFIVLFPIFGIGLVISALRHTVNWLRFGEAPLTLTPFPPQVGGQVGGSLDLPVSADRQLEAEVRLTCFHRYLDRSGDEIRWVKEPLWQDVQSVRLQRLGTEGRVTFAFDIPSNLPATQDKGEDTHVWGLQVKLDRKGMNFERVYEIPMQPAHETLASAGKRHHEHKQSLRIPPDFAVPQIHSGPMGLEFDYGYGRNKGMAIILFFVSLMIALFAGLMFKGFASFLLITSIVMETIMLIFVTLMLLLSLYLVGNRMTIRVNRDGLDKHQRILGFSFREHLARDMIADIKTEKSGFSTSGNDSRVWFSLKLLLKDGREVEVGDSLDGQSVASQVRKQMCDALGSQWKPSEPSHDTHHKLPLPTWLLKLKGLAKMLSYALPLALVYDLLTLFNQIQ